MEYDFREELIKMIGETKDLEFIVFVYKLVKRVKENWGA